MSGLSTLSTLLFSNVYAMYWWADALIQSKLRQKILKWFESCDWNTWWTLSPHYSCRLLDLAFTYLIGWRISLDSSSLFNIISTMSAPNNTKFSFLIYNTDRTLPAHYWEGGGGVNGRGFCLFASHSLGGYTILYVVLFEALFGAVSGLLTKHINRPCILFHWK